MNLASIIFTHTRIGLHGRLFTIFKFRTMYLGAQKHQAKFHHLNQGIPPTFKIKNDPRLTRIGKFLRNTGLDELPQLINILKGDMALIGPRPLPVAENKKLPKKWQLLRQSVKPGIISSWALTGGHNLTLNQWMQLDLQDIQNLHSISYRLQIYRKFVRFFLRAIINSFKN